MIEGLQQMERLTGPAGSISQTVSVSPSCTLPRAARRRGRADNSRAPVSAKSLTPVPYFANLQGSAPDGRQLAVVQYPLAWPLAKGTHVRDGHSAYGAAKTRSGDKASGRCPRLM